MLLVDLASWATAWQHEPRGFHGKWIKAGAGLDRYSVPDHARLVSKAGKYHDPAEHPFFRANPVSPANIVASYDAASPQEKAQGARWYADAHNLAAKMTGGDAREGAILLASYSPQASWPVNMFNAARAAEEHRALGPHDGLITGAMQANAQEALDGKSVDEALTSPKIRAFARLIELGGDAPDDGAGEVVIDRHALSVAAGHTLPNKTSAPIGDPRFHEYVADQFRQAALAISKRDGKVLPPYQLQAITWLHQQAVNEAIDQAGGEGGRGGSALIKGRITSAANAWKRWAAYARAEGIPLTVNTQMAGDYLLPQLIELAAGELAGPGGYLVLRTEDRDDGMAAQLSGAWEHEPRGPGGRWYHATNDDLLPGDIVKPAAQIGRKTRGGPGDEQHVWVSNDPIRAGAYGSRIYEVAPADEPRHTRGSEDEHQTSAATVVREVPYHEARQLSPSYQKQAAAYAKARQAPQTIQTATPSCCPDCGCPDTLSGQIELADGWRDAWQHEARGPHGEWIHGTGTPTLGRSAIEDERIGDAILREWRKSSAATPEGMELNKASAFWDAGERAGTVEHLREAARLARAAGRNDAAHKYQVIAARIETADEANSSLEAHTRNMAEVAVPSVDKMVGGKSAWKGQVYSWEDSDPQHQGIAAEFTWDGRIGIRAGLADEIRRTQEDPHAQVTDPVAYQDLLHELIHSEIPPGDRYASHSAAYQKPDVRAIEEGYTELGAHHHAHEFFDAIGVGSRDTGFLATGEDGGPVPSPAFGKAVSKYAADLQKQYVKLSADPRPPWQQAARHLGGYIEELKSDSDWMLMGGYVDPLDEIQHLGDSEVSKWAVSQRKQAEKILAMPASKHTTMDELADKYDDPLLIDSGSGWGHYPSQTRAAQMWVQDVAKAEGVADMRKGQPGFARVKQLADEINRVGPADKDYEMARQLLRAEGQPDADSNTIQVVAGYIRNHWLESITNGDGLGNYRGAAKFLKMIQAPTMHKMGELSEAQS